MGSDRCLVVVIHPEGHAPNYSSPCLPQWNSFCPELSQPLPLAEVCGINRLDDEGASSFATRV